MSKLKENVRNILDGEETMIWQNIKNRWRSRCVWTGTPLLILDILECLWWVFVVALVAYVIMVVL